MIETIKITFELVGIMRQEDEFDIKEYNNSESDMIIRYN